MCLLSSSIVWVSPMRELIIGLLLVGGVTALLVGAVGADNSAKAASCVARNFSDGNLRTLQICF